MFTAVHADPRVRGPIQPRDLASQLAALADHMDPLVLASELRQQRRFLEALVVIEGASRSERNLDLAMLAADLTASDLNRPMSAIEWYERVITNDRFHMDAHFQQLHVLLHPEILSFVANGAGEVADKLELMLWRDFTELPPDTQKEVVAGVATFYTARSKAQVAQHLLQPYLYQDGTFVWWEIPVSLSYGEALAAAGRLGEASAFLAGVGGSLDRLRTFRPGDPRFVEEEAIDEYQQRLTFLFHRYQLSPQG
jgi:hypothetical protein